MDFYDNSDIAGVDSIYKTEKNRHEIIFNTEQVFSSIPCIFDSTMCSYLNEYFNERMSWCAFIAETKQ